MLSARRAGAVEGAVGVVAVALLAGLLAPAAASAPAPCDADGDGRATGASEVVFSNGDDEAAVQLRAASGTRLPRAEPGRRWRVPVCVEEAAGPDPAAPRRVVSAAPQRRRGGRRRRRRDGCGFVPGQQLRAGHGRRHGRRHAQGDRGRPPG